MTRVRLLCVAVLAAACGDHDVDLGTPYGPAPDAALDAPPAACVDLDGDDYGADCKAGPDCDDTDETRHPGATEVCNDIDDDCDAATDEGVRTICDDCNPLCFVTVYGDGDPISDPSEEVDSVELDGGGDLVLNAGPSTGSYAVVVTGCPEDTSWLRAEWTATVPSGASLALTVRASDDTATIDAATPHGPYATTPAGLAGVETSIYLKLYFAFVAAPGGQSPVLHDFRVVWECDDVK